MAAYDIGNAFDAIEKELIASMIRNMSRHRAEETKEGYLWSQWQAEQLKSLEKYKIQNQKKYGSQFKNLNRQMEALIRLSKEQGGMEQEREILKAIKNGFTGYKKVGSTMQSEFFKLNERKLESLIRATASDMKKAETAVLRMADDQYRKIIFNAQVYANTGAGTYKQAVDMATKDFLSAGLNCVEYANGARHTLSDYAQMAIRTASKRAYLQGEGEKRQEWGISTVIVNKRGNPCPKCLPFVGKVLIDDVWSGGSSAYGNYPLMSKAVAAGLYHPNCKDSHTTYYPGISTADDTWTMEELEAIEKKNKQGAKEQYARRQAEKFERLSENSLDEENKKKYRGKLEKWNTKTDEIKIFGREINSIGGKEKSIKNNADFIIAKSLQEAREYAYRELGVIISGSEGMPLETINSINKQYTEILKKYPHMKGFVQEFDFTESLSKGTYAARKLEYTPDGRINRSILFNKNEYTDIDTLCKNIAQDVKDGQFPKGTGIEGILDHEFGHCLADDMAYRIRKIDIKGTFSAEEWKDIRGSGTAFSKIRIEETAKKLKITPRQLQGKISGYAKENYAESFAEAFSSARGDKPSKEALAVMKEYDRIKKIYIKGE